MTAEESTIIGAMNKMNESLTALIQRVTLFEGKTEKGFTELSGRIKGNHELITKDLSSYVEKDACTSHRESQGFRMAAHEERLTILETEVKLHFVEASKKDSNISEAIIAWLPDVVKVIVVVGAILLAMSKGWISI